MHKIVTCKNRKKYYGLIRNDLLIVTYNNLIFVSVNKTVDIYPRHNGFLSGGRHKVILV